MDKGSILDQTHSLYEKHCTGCRRWRRSGAKQKHHTKAQEFCLKQCPIGVKMKNLGILLEFGYAAKTFLWFTKDVYEDLSKQFTHLEIVEMSGISKSTLYRRLKHWGIPLRHTLTKESYLSMSKKWKDYYIAKKEKISPSTLRRLKRSWGMDPDDRFIKYSLSGEEITFEKYEMYKKRGMSDELILKHWGISWKALRNKKIQWRKMGKIPTKCKTTGGANVGKCCS